MCSDGFGCAFPSAAEGYFLVEMNVGENYLNIHPLPFLFMINVPCPYLSFLPPCSGWTIQSGNLELCQLRLTFSSSFFKVHPNSIRGEAVILKSMGRLG